MPSRIQKDVYLQSLALTMAAQGTCERCEITVFTNNGPHVCMGWYPTCLCSFSPWVPQKSKSPKLFFCIVTTHNGPSCYVRHFFGSSYVFVLPYLGVGYGAGPVSPNGLVHNLLMQFVLPWAAQKSKSPCKGYRGNPSSWAYSRTLPQGVELFVSPLVNSFFSNKHIPQ